jgi:hypothetical protein
MSRVYLLKKVDLRRITQERANIIVVPLSSSHPHKTITHHENAENCFIFVDHVLVDWYIVRGDETKAPPRHTLTHNNRELFCSSTVASRYRIFLVNQVFIYPRRHAVLTWSDATCVC